MPTEKNAPDNKRYYENKDFKYDSLTGMLYHNRGKGPVRKGQLCGQSVNNHGYKSVSIDNRTVAQHNIIWYLVHRRYPIEEIDHISGVRTDNKLENLREVTHRENNRNKLRGKNNKSGVMGVYWSKNREKWRAAIKLKGYVITLGSYKNFNDAVIARKKAEKKYGFHKNHGLTLEERGKYV